MFLQKMRFLADWRTYKEVIEAAAVFFKYSESKIESYQVARFNRIWEDAYSNIPFYEQWKHDNKLPNKIEDLNELNGWPILTKKEIRDNEHLLLRATSPIGFAITSGSTGVPLRIPVSASNATKQNMWIGRAANGYLPGQKTFLIWGHQHLYGSGLKRIKNLIIRRIKDSILGYKRISAYDTSIAAMTKAFKSYNSYKPELVIGYSSTILSFVRCNKQATMVHKPKLVLCTAGPLSEKEREEIRNFFNSPLCMEYGSVECGVMAYTVDDCDHYNVCWNSHIIQGETDDNGNIKNIVTTLTDRYFPLIRYDIGDYLVLSDSDNRKSVTQFNNISGRPTDIVTLSDGTSFFPMLIEACVEHLEGLIAHQLVVDDNCLEILLVASRRLASSDFDSVYKQLFGVLPSLKQQQLIITQVEELHKNAGGKTPLVMRKSQIQ